MNISIIIPTYNGENRISKALEGIKNLIIPKGVICEFLLIDNNSTDNTIEVVNSFNLNFKIIKETKQGSFFARDRGIKESSYNWIFFIDDDIKVQPNWIIEFIKIINNNNNVGLIAAPLKFPESYLIELPDYIKTFKTLFAITEDTIETAAKYNFLSSMFCVNKECYNWLKEKGFKQKLIGRGFNNNPFAGGEDIEYSLTIKYSPYKNYITTDTFGYHYLDKNRLNIENCLKLQETNGYCLSILAPLMLSDKKIFKYVTSYYYFLFRSIQNYFKKQQTVENDIIYKTEKLYLIKNLLKNKKKYQDFEKEIRKAEWNILKGNKK